MYNEGFLYISNTRVQSRFFAKAPVAVKVQLRLKNVIIYKPKLS